MRVDRSLPIFGLESHGREIRLALSTHLLQKPVEMTQMHIWSHYKRNFCDHPSCKWSASLSDKVLKLLLFITADIQREDKSSNSEIFPHTSTPPMTLSLNPKCLHCLCSKHLISVFLMALGTCCLLVWLFNPLALSFTKDGKWVYFILRSLLPS